MSENLKLKIGCTPEELQKAQRLRFAVFNEEMHAGLEQSRETGLDHDEFDQICEHLIIIDTDTNEVIGTYRMLLDLVAQEHQGFYSQREFDLGNLASRGKRMLEVGRSCIHKDYRRRRVLNMMWEGLAQYAMEHNVEYIFGCVSVFSMDADVVSRYFSLLKQMGFFSDIDVQPVDEKHQINIDPDINLENPDVLFQSLPALFRGYLSLGLKVCGMPSVDREFGTTDFFILLDIQNMNKSYKKRLFGNYLQEGSKGCFS